MAVNLSPIGGVAAQFLDNNGNPLTGGKIYTYAAGTTTPQAAYTSAGGGTPHANPIILDAAGRAPSGEIWLTDGLQYKFVIKTSTDVQIGSYDNIIGINSNFVNYTNSQEIQTATAGQTVFTLTTMVYQPGTNSLSVFVDGVNQYGPGALYAYTETSSTVVTFNAGLHVGAVVKFTTTAINASSYGDAEQISYTPPYTSSVPTNVEAKLAQTVSVKDFGAAGDGVTDDSAAINNAANALQTLGGGTLIFPRGDYYVASSTITIPKYVEIKADADAVLIQAAAATNTLLIIEGRPFTETIRRPRHHVLPSLQKGSASGQPLWNAGSDTSSIGLHIKGCSDDTFTLRAIAYFYNGVFMDSNYLVSYTLSVNNTVFLGNVRNCYKGIWLENGANQNTFISGVINTDNAWTAVGTTYITLKGPDCNVNTFVGTNIEGNGSVNLKAVQVESISNLFNSCRIEKLPAGALVFTSSSNGNIWIGGSDKASSVSQGYFDAVIADSGYGNVFQWAGTYSGRHVTVDNGAGIDRQGIGFSAGAFPTAWISAYSATRLWLKGTTASPLAGVRYQGALNQEKLTITSGTNWVAKNANIIVANYAAPQSIIVFTSVGSGTDVNALVTIMDVNGNITLVHTSSPASGGGRFVLKAGVNLLMTANQPVQFMSHDGNWYQV